MTQYVHIVQVHPVEKGKPNLSKIVEEREFKYLYNAWAWIDIRNGRAKQNGERVKAVYHGQAVKQENWNEIFKTCCQR